MNYWGEPHIVTTAPARGIIVSEYVSFTIYPVCRTLVPEIRVRSEVLRVFRYIDVLTCVIYNCRLNSEDYLCLP